MVFAGIIAMCFCYKLLQMRQIITFYMSGLIHIRRLVVWRKNTPVTPQHLLQIFPNAGPVAGVFLVRQAWRVARKRNQLGCGGHAGDLEVKVLYTPGKGKC